MNKSKLTITLLAAFFLLLFLTSVSASDAASPDYESAAVGRIVGDSADELLAILDNEDFNLQHASFYSNPHGNSYYEGRAMGDTKNILQKNFPGNLQSSTT